VKTSPAITASRLVLLLLAIPLAVLAQQESGVITGTLVNTAGQPLAGMTVRVQRVPDGAERFYSEVRTDAGGHYHVSLPAGRYYIEASPCQPPSGNECANDDRLFLYYPGVPSITSARVVTLGAGAAKEASFALADAWIEQTRSEAARLDAQRTDLWRLRTYAPAATSSWPSLYEMHRYFTTAFIATPGMGSGRMVAQSLQPDPAQRLRVADEEGAANVPERSRADGAWVVRELDLIGIAKHDQPVVFSRVAHGADAASQRPLSAFEQQAISKLQGGTIISQQSADTIEAVGAIRAEKACVQCHQPYREGDVLGAFRYVLRRP
jgi:hypothetical protein